MYYQPARPATTRAPIYTTIDDSYYEHIKWKKALCFALIQAAIMIVLAILNPIASLNISTFSLVLGGMSSVLGMAALVGSIDRYLPNTRIIGAIVAGTIELAAIVVLGLLNPVLGLGLVVNNIIWGGLFGFYGSMLLGAFIENSCCNIAKNREFYDPVSDDDDMDKYSDDSSQYRQQSRLEITQKPTTKLQPQFHEPSGESRSRLPVKRITVSSPQNSVFHRHTPRFSNTNSRSLSSRPLSYF